MVLVELCDCGRGWGKKYGFRKLEEGVVDGWVGYGRLW